MRRLVVVGGGISGLAAAWTAQATDPDLEVTVIEKDRDLGGKAQSYREGPWLVETGPLGYLDNEPELTALAHDAGLGDALLPATDAATRRFVYRAGRVREIAAHPLRLATAGILGPTGVARILLEPFVPPRRQGPDESVWDFAARRVGRQFADRLIHPMVLGIFAGDAKALSLPAAFPVMAELERQHGSLIRGAIARGRARRKAGTPKRASTLTSFEAGLQSLPLTLASEGRFNVRTNTAVEQIARHEDGWRIMVSGERTPMPADAVILATEPWAMAHLLEPTSPDLAAELNAIDCPPICVVGLGYDGLAAKRIPRGFGVLIPRGERFRTLGVTWDSHLFAGRAAEGQVLVRAMLGGTYDARIDQLDIADIRTIVEEEVRMLFGLEASPVFCHAKLWSRAIPQYSLGHLDRVARIEEHVRAQPGLFLGGNGLYGTSFAKAGVRGITCGRDAAVFVRARRDG